MLSIEARADLCQLRWGCCGMKLQSDQKAIVHVVDDDASMREALQNLFLSIGIEARTYATARDFLTTAVLDDPGCVVIDIRLPDMNGLDFQAQLTQTGVRLPEIGRAHV